MSSPDWLTGSLVSSIQGEPRATHDIDIAVTLPMNNVEAFLREFPQEEYYCDLEDAKSAMGSDGMFNILMIDTGDKVDIWAFTKSAFDRSRFARRETIRLFDMDVKVSSPEDTILMKLLWAKMSGGSEKQLFDAAKVYETQSDILDQSYLNDWMIELGLSAEFAGMKRFLTSGKLANCGL